MENYLVISPENELIFQLTSSSGNQSIKQTITVTNAHPDAVITFKVKTTAPKQYSVKPSVARLEPGASCQVQTLFQIKDDSKPDYKRKDKFQIQSIKIPPAVMKLDSDAIQTRIQELWAQTEQLAKTVPDGGQEIIAQRKLKCVLLPPPGEVVEEITSNSSVNRRTSAITQEYNDTQDVVAQLDRLKDSKVLPQSNELQLLLTQAQEKLKTVQAACDGYKAELDRVNHLRQRRQESSTALNLKASNALKTPNASGVPIQMVALMCLFAFLLGVWLF